MNKRNVKWHRLSADAAVKQLHTNASCGLSRKEARSRYRRYGENTLFDKKKRQSSSILKTLLCDPALLLLLFICVLACFFSELAAGLCTLICFLCGMMFALRLAYMEKRMRADIARYRVPTVLVIRDGKEYLISSRHVVPGDVILLRKGDIIPADCRLLSCQSLKVLTLSPHKDTNRPTWLALPKSADRVYPFGESISSPNQENMIFGGSEIVEGSARAVVTEIGVHTFLGAMETFAIPDEFHAETRKHTRNGVYSYLKLYAFSLFLLLIPITVIGMLTVPEDLGILRLFLSISALCGSGAQAFLLLHFQGAAVSMQARGLTLSPYENRFVVKASGTAETLSSLTDIFVRGHCGISDGILHLHSIATGSGESLAGERLANPMLRSVCEAYFLLHDAEPISKQNDLYASVRQELISASGFDRVAMKVRLVEVTRHDLSSSNDALLQVKMKDTEFELLFTEELACLKQCLFYEERDGSVRMLTSVQREALFHFASSTKEQGCRLQVLLRRQSGRIALIGVVAMREQPQAVLSSVIEELRQCGVRVTFLLQDCEHDRCLSAAAGLLGKGISADACAASSRSMTDFIEKYRVFYGFSERDIGNCVRALKKNGCKIAVLGTHIEDLPLLQLSDLAVSCDSMRRFEGRSQLPVTGRHITEEDCKGDSALLRHADLLIHSAKRLGGGLSSLLRMISDCRAIQYKIPVIFRFLFSSHFVRLLLTLISVCFGKGIMSGAQLLYSGMLCETVGVLWILSLFVPQSSLRRPQVFSDVRAAATLSDRGLWLPALLSGVTVSVYIVVLCFCNVITTGGATSFLFSSLLLLQLTALFAEARRSGLIFSWKQALIPVLIVWIPTLILISFSVAFSAFHRVTELGEWSLVSLLSLPLSPLSYALFFRFFDRTAK